MAGTEINEIFKEADVGALMKPTSVIYVHDAEARVAYKATVKTLAKAVARHLVEDGLIAPSDD